MEAACINIMLSAGWWLLPINQRNKDGQQRRWTQTVTNVTIDYGFHLNILVWYIFGEDLLNVSNLAIINVCSV